MKDSIIKCTLFFVTICSISIVSYTQQGKGGLPKSTTLLSSNSIAAYRVFEEPNISRLRAEDKETDGKGIAPWRFGYNNSVQIDLFETGSLVDLDNGDQIWFLKLECTNALTVNLTFENSSIPEGNELYVYNPDKTTVLGAFTSNHLYEGQLGTELISGSTAIIEYYIPQVNKNLPTTIQLAKVTHGYRTAQEFKEKAFGDAGNCNMNVNCPDGAEWVNQRNSVVMLVSGSNGFCSGALINNTNYDGKPYVLTASHCYSDPTNWVFRFNWQAEGCQNPSMSPSFQSLSGAALRARRTPSDMCLVEITGGLENETVPASYSPYFAGWNNLDVEPSRTVGVHHPRGDIKKISFDDNSAHATQAMGSTEANSSWEVVWDRNTTTEGGSSGSPLFDQNGRIIGQLWGGGANCSNLTLPDWYGRVHNSWNPENSDASNQLKHWLDPDDTGIGFIDGYSLGDSRPELDGALGGVFNAQGTYCLATISPSFLFVNLGTEVITSASFSYTYTGLTSETYDWTGSLVPFASVMIELPEKVLLTGEYTLSVTVLEVNEQEDDIVDNNETQTTFNTIVDGEEIHLSLQLDCYGSETSWRIENSLGNVVHTGGPYTNSDSNPELVSQSLCLQPACYTFILLDSYGDGMDGGQWCSTLGYLEITNPENEMLTELTTDESNFGFSVSLPFCTDGTNSLTSYSEKQISIYPNPTTGKLNLQLNFGGDKTIEIYCANGTLIQMKQTANPLVDFDLSQQAKGVYLVHVLSENSRIIKKVVLY
jgi:lysyl endopeptidase